MPPERSITPPPPGSGGEHTPPKDLQLQDILGAGASEGLRVVREHFEHPANPDNRLAYHGVTHSSGVIDRTGKILKAIRAANPALVSEKDIASGKFAAAWHDTVQKWQSNEVRTPQGLLLLKRKRALGDNERASAELADAYLQRENERPGMSVVSQGDRTMISQAILLTTPNFDVQLGTVTQPNFASHSDNPVAQAIALADLGGGGMEGPGTARWETDTLFVEDNLDVGRFFRGESPDLSVDEKAQYKERMLDWITSQQRFSQGRQRQLELEIASMHPDAQEPVRQLFTAYPETIAGIRDLLEQRREMDFDTIVADIQLTLQNPPSYVLANTH